MEVMSWKEVFFGNKSLNQLREENNLNIPQEYIGSTRRLAIAIAVCWFFLGVLLAFGLFSL